MHSEKTICENVMKTIFGNKDSTSIQEDLKECDLIHICGYMMWRVGSLN
jgi:hypothetical protein